MPGAVGAVATLLTKIFGFVVDPTGLAAMKREHELEVIHAAYKIALDRGDTDAVDALLARLRELSQKG
jgi:hypothetical protein